MTGKRAYRDGERAHTVKASFEYHVGDALIQSLGAPVGNQAMASNGDVVTIVATVSSAAPLP